MANSVIRLNSAELAETAALGVALTDAEIATKLEAGPVGLNAKGSVSVSGVCVDYSGNIYVSDLDNHIILKIEEGGKTSVLAGKSGVAGDNGTLTNVAALDARFNSPVGLACDKSGNVYVADSGNHQIRVIRNGRVSHLAGVAGSAGFTNGGGSTAEFDTPWDIDVTPSGVIYVADSGNHSIRKIVDGTVSTFAGNAAGDKEDVAASAGDIFDAPLGVAVDPNGNIYVCDTGNYKIKKIAPRGWVYRHSGSGVQGKSLGTTAFDCEYNNLRHSSVDRSGNLYVVDANTANGTRLLRVSEIGIPATINDLDGSTYNDDASAVAVSPAGKLFVVVFD
jgi:sugar lactone lactonase YvrE